MTLFVTLYTDTFWLINVRHWKRIFVRTLQISWSDTRIFLAATSRWTNVFLERYSIPDEICLLKFSKSAGRSDGAISCFLYQRDTHESIWKQMLLLQVKRSQACLKQLQIYIRSLSIKCSIYMYIQCQEPLIKDPPRKRQPSLQSTHSISTK